MNPFIQGLNRMRVEGSAVLHDNLPEITQPSDIAKWTEVIFQNPQVYSEFTDGLVSKLIKSQFESKIYNNKLAVFEGEEIPFGYSIENAYTNPAIAYDYDPSDFAGVLARYEADTKVEYFKVNLDKQLKVTIYRDDLRKAMTSFDALAKYITELTNSLYNGAYILMKRRTIGLVASAYENNRVIIKTVSAVTDKDTAEAFSVLARTLYLDFQEESSEFNAWKLNGGAGRPVVTWTEPDDIYILIKNSVKSQLDIKSLANSFNIEYSKLMGKVIGVSNFDAYDDFGQLVKKEDKIVAIICDRRFFKIHTQEMYMEQSRNASARATTYFLNLIKTYATSLFANAVVIATEQPVVNPTSMTYGVETVTIDAVGDDEGLEITTVPASANATISYESKDEDVFIVEADPNNNKIAQITATGEGTAKLVATCGDVTAEVEITVPTSA